MFRCVVDCRTISIWNCETNEETIILEGVHESICTDVIPLELNGKQGRVVD